MSFFNNPILLLTLAGLGFGSWPLMVRYSQLSPMLTTVAVAAGTFIAAAILGFSLNRQPLGSPSSWNLPFIAGLVNGVGFAAYTALVANPKTQTGHIIAGLVLMIMVIAIGGVLFFRESLTPSKAIGLILIAFGIFLINR